jgi:AraC-like DNA-binding protein
MSDASDLDDIHELPDPGLRLLLVRRHCGLRWDTGRNLAAPFWRLYWARSAGGYLVAGGNKLALEPGQLLLMPPQLNFRGGQVRPFDKLFAHFTLRPGWEHRCGRPLVFTMTAGRRRRLASVWRSLEGDGGEARSALLLHALLAELLCTLKWQTQAAPGHEDERMTRALAVQVRRWDKTGFTVARWATEAGVSVETLHRLFRRHLATTPHRHLMAERLRHAETMLREGEASIEHIAAACGFADRFHFTRMFTRARQVSPARYRRLRYELRVEPEGVQG